MTTHRLSPVHGRLEALGARFAELDGMLVAGQIGNGDAARARVLGLADLSHLQKTGFKGGDAAAGVRDQGLVLPEPNSWAEVDGGGMLARLARSEFFIEDGIGGQLVARVRTMLRQMPAGIYPVMRQDAGFALTGERANELLVETCNVNFGELAAESRNVVMTSMVGVSVLVVRRDNGQRPCYRLWCDPTMAPYLWDTLAGIALELGGGPVGSDVLAASPQA